MHILVLGYGPGEVQGVWPVVVRQILQGLDVTGRMVTVCKCLTASLSPSCFWGTLAPCSCARDASSHPGSRPAGQTDPAPASLQIHTSVNEKWPRLASATESGWVQTEPPGIPWGCESRPNLPWSMSLITQAPPLSLSPSGYTCKGLCEPAGKTVHAPCETCISKGIFKNRKLRKAHLCPQTEFVSLTVFTWQREQCH